MGENNIPRYGSPSKILKGIGWWWFISQSSGLIYKVMVIVWFLLWNMLPQDKFTTLHCLHKPSWFSIGMCSLQLMRGSLTCFDWVATVMYVHVDIKNICIVWVHFLALTLEWEDNDKTWQNLMDTATDGEKGAPLDSTCLGSWFCQYPYHQPTRK